MPPTRKTRKRLVEAEDICRLEVINDVALSQDESYVAYTMETVSENRRKYYSRIYVGNCKTGKARQYTYGEVSDRGLAWSPDGTMIAFLSTRDKKTGIYVIHVEGGAERKVYEADGAFIGLQWTPDGKDLVFAFRFNDTHNIKDDDKKREAPVFRHVTRLFYRLDGAGFLPKDSFHIWRVNVESGKATQVTKGKYDDLMPAVSPNGKTILFVSNRTKDPDLQEMYDSLYTVPFDGGRLKKVPTPDGPKSSPVFSPDGKRIAYIGHERVDNAWGVASMHIYVVGVNGRPAAKDIIPGFDRHAIDQTISDIGEGMAAANPVWSSDGKRIYFSASDTGNTHVFYVPSKGGRPTRITKKNCHVKKFSMAGRCKQIAAIIADLSQPGQVCLIPPVYNGDRKMRRITKANEKLFKEIDFPQTKEVYFPAHDGTQLQGWLVTPSRRKKGKTYPAILEIHGGPRVQYGFTFFHEMLYLAAQGFVVFYTNPRGGNGRGETFAESIVGDWGGIDYQDCMAAADYLEKLPMVNPRKIGVTGGSYGGYMTNWIIGQTARFRAAVTQRSVVNLEEFVGSSDIGFMFRREYMKTHWEDPELYRRCSPITYARNVKTPLLIIHSEQDLRCGIEQAEMLFATLKMMKKRVEFVRFPEEPHGLSRHGRPDRRLARLDWISKWFKKYLR